MIDINNCDKIIVETNDKMERIITWYQQNIEVLNSIEFHSPIPSGVIEFKEECISVAYESDGPFVSFYLYMDGVYVCNFKYNPNTRKSMAPIIFPPGISKDKRKSMQRLLFIDNTLNKCTLKYHALMCFATHYRNYVEVSETKRTQVSTMRTVKKKHIDNTTPLITTYRIDNRPIPNAPDELLAKRPYTKPTEEFSVRGYYRTTKTGKRVWVRPFTKYSGKSAKKKTYKV